MPSARPKGLSRSQCREILESINGDSDKIEHWNLSRFWRLGKEGLDLSDADDPWNPDSLILTDGVKGVDLRNAKLTNVCFEHGDLSNCNLQNATLSKADFHSVTLVGCQFEHSVLTESHFFNCNCKKANFSNAKMLGAKIHETDFAGANFSRTIFDSRKYPFGSWLESNRKKNARLRKYKFLRMLYDKFYINSMPISPFNEGNNPTILDDADIRYSTGFIANGQSVRGARFSSRAMDPYNILRSIYTGPMLMFHLVFLFVFFSPLVIRAAAWALVESVQTSDVGRTAAESLSIDSGVASVSPEMIDRSALWVVLGFSSDVWGVIAGILSLLFVLYNILRAVITWWMSRVRDAEERSSHLPEVHEYWWCYILHSYFMRWVFWAAVFSFLYHAARWATSTITVPVSFA